MFEIIAVVRFLYVAHIGNEEILVYVRELDNSLKFSHVSALRLSNFCQETHNNDDDGSSDYFGCKY